MFTYEIKLENDKYNIYYYTEGILDTKEFYAYNLDEPLTIIRYGYKEQK